MAKFKRRCGPSPKHYAKSWAQAAHFFALQLLEFYCDAVDRLFTWMFDCLSPRKIGDYAPMQLRDIFVEVVARVFAVLGVFQTLFNLVWEVVSPPVYLKSVNGQNILIVGNCDVARGIAIRLHQRGAHLILWGLDAFSERNVLVVSGQPASASDVKRVAKLKDAQIVVFVGSRSPAEEFPSTDAEVTSILSERLHAYINIAREFVPRFLERRSGHFVVVSATSGLVGTPHICTQAAVEYAVVGLIKSLEADATARGINDVKFSLISVPVAQLEDLSKIKSGKSTWPKMDADELCDAAVLAILSNRRTVVLPWPDDVLLSLEKVISHDQFVRLVARRWPYRLSPQLPITTIPDDLSDSNNTSSSSSDVRTAQEILKGVYSGN